MSHADAELPHLCCPATAGQRAPALLVMLAGAYDRAQDFVDHGFDRACRESRQTLDLCFVTTRLDAVADGRIATLLHQQLIAPARAAGYGRLLLGGISIGGQVALIHQDEYPDSIDALALIAPYPGNRMITGELSRAGGLMDWRPPSLGAEQGELRAWRSLRRSALGDGPPVWLGYGEQDRFAGAHRMMGAALDPQAVVALPGAHDWPTWKNLWNNYLNSGIHP